MMEKEQCLTQMEEKPIIECVTKYIVSGMPGHFKS